jgi:hypothetical protein
VNIGLSAHKTFGAMDVTTSAVKRIREHLSQINLPREPEIASLTIIIFFNHRILCDLTPQSKNPRAGTIIIAIAILDMVTNRSVSSP